MAQYTVIFFKENIHWLPSSGEDKVLRKEMRSGKTTLTESFEYAVENGANPQDTIQYRWEE